MANVRSRLATGIPVGVVATVTMDAAMLVAGRLGGDAFASQRLDPAVIGRWGGGLLRGRWRHADASREEAGALDIPMGLATHYSTGIALTEAYLLIGGRSPTFAAAVRYGIATSLLPLLVLFPALGYGPLGLRSGEAARLVRVMLVGHVGFGAGIGLGTALLGLRRR